MINKSIEELDFVTARKYIEQNLDLLKEKKSLLKSNARDLLNFLEKQKFEPIKRNELAIINSINLYSTKFDIRGLKFVIRENNQLMLRKDLLLYLNSDAKALLESMKVI
jgi:predicted nucleic acid-binding protein